MPNYFRGMVMAKWPAILTKEAIREGTSALLWSYWPYWGAPIVSAILSYLGGYSAALIFLSALFAFAMVALGLNNFSQWAAVRTPADKVRFAVPSIGTVNNTSNPPALRGLKLGVGIQSVAPFPVEVQVDKLETQISDKVPVEPFFSRSTTIGQGGIAQFNNAVIELPKTMRKKKLLYGRISAEISYGRPGKLHYHAEHQYYLALMFDNDGNFQNAEVSTTEFSGTP
jgi:hypothetical protein